MDLLPQIKEVSISLSEIIVAILTIFTTGFGFIIKEQKEKIKAIQTQLSDKKYIVYHEVFSIFFDVFKEQKGFITLKENELAIRVMDVKI